MAAVFTLCLSVILQLGAAIQALRLIRVTGRRLAWTLIAAGLSLMAIRRGMTLVHALGGDPSHPPDLPTELVALAISLLMFCGVGMIAPIFRSARRAADALRESEQRYRAVVEDQAELICRFLPDLRLTFVNEAYCRYFGRTREELLGHSFTELIPRAEHERVAKDIALLGRANPVATHEHQITTGAGRLCWQQWTNRAILDPNGRVIEFQAVGRDITERKDAERALREAHDELELRVVERTADLTAANQRLLHEIAERKRAEQTLRESEKKYRTLIENLPQRIFYKNKDSVYISCNRSYAQDLGTVPESIAGKTDYEFYPRDLADKYRTDDRRIIQSGKIEDFEERYVQGTQELTVQTVKIPVRDEAGKVVGILGIFWDITDRKRDREALLTRLRYEEALAECSRALLVEADAEEALEDALRFLRKASDVSRVYLFENFTDPVDGLCMRQTHEVCDAGVVPEIGNPLLRHVEYKNGFQRWQEKLAKGEPVRGLVRDLPACEQEVLAPQGIRSLLVLPISSEGQWYGFIGFDDTQTPRLWTQEDIRLLQTAAEMIGAFIAGRRAEARLREAKEAAEAASRAKSAFLANMSHEIRTPITATLAAAELLSSRGPDQADRPEHIDVILRNGRHLLALIDDLLELSRAEARGPSARRVSCSLLDIMADVQAVTRPLHQRAAVDFRILFDTPIPQRIHTDPTRLKQAIINLTSNALKFTETGHVWVRVSVDRKRPEPRLTVAVEDTGMGIPAAETERIFETFAQLRPGPTGVFGGVGLGLPVARGIAEQLGGKIEVHSVENRGSTFTLRVSTGPLEETGWVTCDTVSIPASAPTSGISGSRPVSAFRGTILLAEDFVDTRRMIEETLTGCGVTVTSVENGEEAVRRATTGPFDVILMDVRMPVMDGVTATAELRRRGCLTPIIALTASTDPDDRARILDAGFDDIWTKPMTLEDLVEEVASYLHSASSEAEHATPASTSRIAAGTVNERLAAAREEFVRRLPTRLNRIAAAVRKGDSQEAADALHQLAGSGGIHGFMSLSHESARLLELAHQGGLANHPLELTTLQELIEQIVTSGT